MGKFHAMNKIDTSKLIYIKLVYATMIFYLLHVKGKTLQMQTFETVQFQKTIGSKSTYNSQNVEAIILAFLISFDKFRHIEKFKAQTT